MTNALRLYLIETNPNRAANLAAELAQLPQVHVFRKYEEVATASGGLDALFVPLMSALEWGAIKPPAPLHRTQVVKMPDYEIAKGRPEFAIPGVATSMDETLSPISTTRLVLTESFKAIRQFNSTSSIKLRSVAAVTLSLGLDKLRSEDALLLLREAFSVLA